MAGTIFMISIGLLLLALVGLWLLGERGKLLLPSTWKVLREAGWKRQFNLQGLHGYVYGSNEHHQHSDQNATVQCWHSCLPKNMLGERLYDFVQMAATSEIRTIARRVRGRKFGPFKRKNDRFHAFGTKYDQNRFLH